MTTILDRYLVSRFLHVFVILFLSLFGLFVVIDGFEKIDEFTDGRSAGQAALVMAQYYALQSALFFDSIGSILAVSAVMVVFALLQKHSEILPALAAGVPMRRLLRPVVVGMLALTGLIVLNQELLLPRIASHLAIPRNQKAMGDKPVEATYDHQTQIHISGRALYIREKRMDAAKFALPVNAVALEPTTIRATQANWIAATAGRPAGWLLHGAQPNRSQLRLTEAGAAVILPADKPDEMLIATGLDFDQLYSRDSSYKYLSTLDLVRRLRNPSDIVSIKAQLMHLHQRLVRPLLNLSCVFIAVPLIVRRESRSLIASFTLCSVVLGLLLGLLQLCAYLGQANLLRADWAAWAPIIACGAVGAWVYDLMQS